MQRDLFAQKVQLYRSDQFEVHKACDVELSPLLALKVMQAHHQRCRIVLNELDISHSTVVFDIGDRLIVLQLSKDPNMNEPVLIPLGHEHVAGVLGPRSLFHLVLVLLWAADGRHTLRAPPIVQCRIDHVAAYLDFAELADKVLVQYVLSILINRSLVGLESLKLKHLEEVADGRSLLASVITLGFLKDVDFDHAAHFTLACGYFLFVRDRLLAATFTVFHGYSANFSRFRFTREGLLHLWEFFRLGQLTHVGIFS